MTTEARPALRTFTFGDLATSLWGVAAAWDSGSVASFADTVDVEAAGAEDDWTLTSAGVELRFTATGETSALYPADAGVDGHVQTCAVQGALRRDGADLNIDTYGTRAMLAVPALGDGSLRAAIGWFGPGDGFALVSQRQARTSGHEHDVLGCALLDDGQAVPIAEPRLSTTYTEAGVPQRAGLELWLDGGDADESEEEDRPVYPWRAAGETVGDGVRLEANGVHGRVELFRWYARKREGAGVYVLVPAP
jgi:hypothetical protein